MGRRADLETGDWFLLVGLLPVMAAEAALAQLNDPARNALVPTLVPKDALLGRQRLIGLNANLARLAGSPLGGLLAATSGLPGLIIGDAASFLIGAALIGLVRRGAVVRPAPSEHGEAPENRPAPEHPATPEHRAAPERRAAPLPIGRPGLSQPSRSEGPRWGSVAATRIGRRRLSTAPVPGAAPVSSAASALSAALVTSSAAVPTAAPDPTIARVPASTVAPGPTAVPHRTAAEPRGVVGEWVDGLRGVQAIGGLLGDAVGVVPVLNGQAGLYLLAGLVAVTTLGRARPAGQSAGTTLTRKCKGL